MAELPLTPETPEPEPNLNSELDRVAIIAEGEPIPEASAALGGLRKAIIDRRIGHAQDKIEGLAEDHEVLKFVKGKIKVIKPYSDLKTLEDKSNGEEHVRPPVTYKQLKASQKLEKLERRRRNLVGLRHNLSRPLNPNLIVERKNAAGEKEPISPSLLTLPKVNSREHAVSRKAKKRDDEHRGRIEKIDRKMAKIVHRPVKKAQKTIERRDRLIRRHEAITRAQAAAASKRSTS